MKNRDIIDKQVDEELDTEEKVVKVQYDGRQYFIKIPTGFSETLQLKKGDQMKFVMNVPEKGDVKKTKIELVLL